MSERIENFESGSLEYLESDKEFSDDQWKMVLLIFNQIFHVGKTVGINESDIITIVEQAGLPQKLKERALFKLGLFAGMKICGHEFEFDTK